MPGVVYTSQNVVWGTPILNAMLLALKTNPAAALWLTPKLRLSMAPAFAPVPTSTATGLAVNEATYTGYAAGGVVPTIQTGLNLTATKQTLLISALFTASGSAVGNTVYGYWADDGTNMVIGEKFGGGFTATFAASGDYLDLQVLLPLPALVPIP